MQRRRAETTAADRELGFRLSTSPIVILSASFLASWVLFGFLPGLLPEDAPMVFVVLGLIGVAAGVLLAGVFGYLIPRYWLLVGLVHGWWILWETFSPYWRAGEALMAIIVPYGSLFAATIVLASFLGRCIRRGGRSARAEVETASPPPPSGERARSDNDEAAPAGRETQAVCAAMADAIEACVASRISYRELLDKAPDSDDDDIGWALHLVEHLPKRGGLLGVREDEYRSYLEEIASAVARLRE